MKKYLFVFLGVFMSTVSYAAVENATQPGQYGGATFDCNAGYYRAGLLKCLRCPDSGEANVGTITVRDCFMPSNGSSFSNEKGSGVILPASAGSCTYYNDYSTGNDYVYLTSVDPAYLDELADKIAEISGLASEDISYILANPDTTGELLNHVAIIDSVSYSAANSIVNDLQSYGSTTASYGVMPNGDYGLFLTGFGTAKIAVIQAVREISGIELKNAKEVVESSSEANPQPVVVAISEEVATYLKSKITDAGGTAIIQAYK